MAKKMKRAATPTADLVDLEGLAKEYVDARYERDAASKRMEVIRDQLLEAMETSGDDSTVAGTYSIVVAHPTTAVLDEPGLASALGKSMWDKVTTKSLDKNKLDAFVKSGEINPDVVAEHTELIERNPSLRVTAKK